MKKPRSLPFHNHSGLNSSHHSQLLLKTKGLTTNVVDNPTIIALGKTKRRSYGFFLTGPTNLTKFNYACLYGTFEHCGFHAYVH